MDTKFTLKTIQKHTVTLSEADVFALLAARAVLKQSVHKTLFARYEYALNQLQASVHMPEMDTQLAQRFSAASVPVPTGDVQDRWFDTIAAAMAQNCCLEITYQAPNRDAEVRIVEPYHLRYIEARWVLYAYCQLRKDLRVFSLPRISQVTVLPDPQTQRKHYSIGKLLKNIHKIWLPQQKWEIELAVSPAIIPALTCNRYFKSQNLSPLGKGEKYGITTKSWEKFSFKTYSLEEAIRWIRSLGSQVVVLRPLPLVQHFADAFSGSKAIDYNAILKLITLNCATHEALIKEYVDKPQAVIDRLTDEWQAALEGVAKSVLFKRAKKSSKSAMDHTLADLISAAQSELYLLLADNNQKKNILFRYNPEQGASLKYYIMRTLYFRLMAM